jgi:3-hydroxymyristoyl/3-hydroxydecanoyl-(acyl carrier protein) dehydratase
MHSFDLDMAVPHDLSCFAGHFPAMPLVPGALLLDWAIAEMTVRWGASVPFIVKQCKFLLPVFPGDALQLRVTVVDQRADFVWIRGPQSVCAGVLTLGEIA